MAESQFLYVIFVRTTPEKLWRALIEPEFTRRYWFATTQESAWTAGAPWCIRFADGRTADSGEVVEIEPERKLVLKWRHEVQPELTAEGYSRLTFEIAQQGDVVKLTVLHEMDRKDSKFIQAASGGWPIILSSLKSLLETGESLEATSKSPTGR
jgi:uncharacterized protein YndB with AHSA1/START domain